MMLDESNQIPKFHVQQNWVDARKRNPPKPESIYDILHVKIKIRCREYTVIFKPKGEEWYSADGIYKYSDVVIDGVKWAYIPSGGVI